MIYISGLAYEELTSELASEGFKIRVLSPSRAVSQGISMHPDIFMCKLGTAPKTPVFKGNEGLLGPEYPADVLYNAVVTEKFMICNTRTVSPELVRAAEELFPDLMIIDVKQGYTKCNVIPVDDSHFITEDEGIARALMAAGASDPLSGPEVLLIRPGHVELPGYDRGFIGGCCGRIGDDIWFNGDISAHPDYESIRKMITSCGLGIRYVPGKPLLDIGSIIEGPDHD
ncbi:MAG: hypothetical protein II164_01510 [Firmicutes bacterium]|nr:hypothetical protein [Bacillota bacterium]